MLMLTESHIVMMRKVAVGEPAQIFAAHSHLKDKKGVRVQHFVLVGEVENGVLTWEEKDNLAAQT